MMLRVTYNLGLPAQYDLQLGELLPYQTEIVGVLSRYMGLNPVLTLALSPPGGDVRSIRIVTYELIEEA